MIRFLQIAGVAFAIVLMVWAVGLVWFIRQINLPVPSNETVTDGVIVLTGGRGRTEHGIDLLVAGAAHKLLVSGVHRGVMPPALDQLEAERPQLFACCVTLGYDAVDTEGNAREAARWLSAERFHSIRLVTADYHMPRALLEFRRLLPPDTLILPDPVSRQETRIDFGREWLATVRHVVTEYMKYLVAVTRTTVSPPAAPTRPNG